MGFAGFERMPIRERFGITSLNSCICLPISSVPRKLSPVTLPPGRASVSTSADGNGVGDGRRDDGDGADAAFGRKGSLRSVHDDDIHLEPNQLGDQFWQALGFVACSLDREDEVLPFYPPELFEPLIERRLEVNGSIERRIVRYPIA